MNVNPNFDARLAAFTSASAAGSSATAPFERDVADAIGFLAQSIEQLNLKLDAILAAQNKLLQR